MVLAPTETRAGSLSSDHWSEIAKAVRDYDSGKILSYARSAAVGNAGSGIEHREYLGRRHWSEVALVLQEKVLRSRRPAETVLKTFIYAMLEKHAACTLDDYFASLPSRIYYKISPNGSTVPLRNYFLEWDGTEWKDRVDLWHSPDEIEFSKDDAIETRDKTGLLSGLLLGDTLRDAWMLDGRHASDIRHKSPEELYRLSREETDPEKLQERLSKRIAQKGERIWDPFENKNDFHRQHDMQHIRDAWNRMHDHVRFDELQRTYEAHFGSRPYIAYMSQRPYNLIQTLVYMSRGETPVFYTPTFEDFLIFESEDQMWKHAGSFYNPNVAAKGNVWEKKDVPIAVGDWEKDI